MKWNPNIKISLWKSAYQVFEEQNFCTMQIPHGEKSARRKFLTARIMDGENFEITKFPYGKKSVRDKFRTAKIPTVKNATGKILRRKFLAPPQLHTQIPTWLKFCSLPNNKHESFIIKLKFFFNSLIFTTALFKILVSSHSFVYECAWFLVVTHCADLQASSNFCQRMCSIEEVFNRNYGHAWHMCGIKTFWRLVLSF